MQECQTCGGRYEPVLPDGMQYFHVCPPLAVHELRDALNDGRLRLLPGKMKELQAAQQRDQENPAPLGETTHVDRFLASLVVERPGKRDENVAGHDADDAPIVKAPGKGTIEVVDEDRGPGSAVVDAKPSDPVRP